MTTLEFIASLAASLAWPAALVMVALLLRKYLPELFRALKRVKFSGLELELERARVEVQAFSTQDRSTDPLGAPTSDSTLTAEVIGDPTASILHNYRRLEDELRKHLSDAGIDDSKGRSAPQLAAIGVREGVFTDSAAEAVKGVSVMRNLVAHGRADRVTAKEATEYAVLIEATLFTLRQSSDGDSSR